MDLIVLLILGLCIALLLFSLWYLVEKCFAAYDTRKARERRRVRFQTVWRASSTSYGDELDYILTKKD